MDIYNLVYGIPPHLQPPLFHGAQQCHGILPPQIGVVLIDNVTVVKRAYPLRVLMTPNTALDTLSVPDLNTKWLICNIQGFGIVTRSRCCFLPLKSDLP
eukprot:sb/3478774/